MTDPMADFQLVPTKLNRPMTDSRCVVRHHLLSAMDEAFSRKLTLISAPAGYGKTTLAVQWLDHIPHPFAWLSLDEHDSEPDRFLRYVIAAIRKIFPRFSLQLEPLLSSPTLPPPEYLADILISDLTELNEMLVLALDDFHTIAGEAVPVLMRRLVQYLPERLHLVIATRVDPPLPLPQWRAGNWLDEIRAAHLRFSLKEAQTYFASLFKGKLSVDAVSRITARTEGWVAGLQLARLSLTDAENPDALARKFSGSDRMVVDFLMDEVLSRQPDEVKHFLSVSSMLERFCAPLCDYVLGEESGIPDSRRLIQLLEKENLFLVPLDGDGVWYRYHHLFQTLLDYRMKTPLPQSRKAEIHRRAGEWHAGQGDMENGLRHLIAAGDLDAAAVLLEENMHTIIDRDLSRRTLGRWLDLFPSDARKQRPALLVAHAFEKMFRWDLAGGVPLMDRAESLLKKPGIGISDNKRQSLLGDIEAHRACCLFWQGDTKGALHHGHQGMKIVPKGHRYAHNVAVTYTAGAKAQCGQMNDALHLLDEALAMDCSEGSPSAALLLTSKIAIFLYAANPGAVEENARKILAVHKTAPQPDYWLGYAPYFIGTTAYERNLLDSAADQFGRVRQMRYRVNTRMYHDALIGLILVAWARADAEAAEKYAAEAFSFAVEANDPISMQISDSIQVRLAVLKGDILANPASYKPMVDGNLFWLESPSLTRAEYLVNKGNHRDCSAGLDFIEESLKMVRHYHNVRLEIQFLAVKAVALKCTGRLNQALQLLEKTLRLAEPRGLVRTFIDRGPLMAELLITLRAKRPGNQYAKSLLDTFGDKVSPEKSDEENVDHSAYTEPSAAAFHSFGLSNRELDILILLKERLTNKEIAGRLYISPITVKTHTANIYRKLKVKNRRQAVARAVQMGLLPSNLT